MDPVMKEQLAGALRTVLAIVLGYLAGKKIIPVEMVNELALALSAIGIAVWSGMQKRKSATVAVNAGIEAAATGVQGVGPKEAVSVIKESVQAAKGV